MAATVEICESNGGTPGSPVNTHSIADMDYGSTEASGLNPTTYPITRGTYCYEKWIYLDVTDMSTSTKIDNIQIWKSAGTITLDGTIGTGIGTAGTYLTTLDTTGSYTTNKRENPTEYIVPVNTVSIYAVNNMPTADPTTANLGINGSLAGSITGVDVSDYFVSQLYIDTDAAVGPHNTLTITFQYDEQ